MNRRPFAVALSVALVSLGLTSLLAAQQQDTPPAGAGRTDKGLYLLRVVEPGYDVTVTERERAPTFSVLEMNGLVPTVTAGGVVIFRAVYDIAKERGFEYTFGLPPRPESGNTSTRGAEGRRVSTVVKVFMTNDGNAPLKELLGLDYTEEAQKVFDLRGYQSVAQLALLSGGGGIASDSEQPNAPAPLRATPLSGRVGYPQGSPSGLVGHWKAVSGEFAGQALPQSQLPKLEMIFEGDGRWRDAEGAEATWAIDDSTSPKRLELAYTAGRDAGQKQLCVYEVADDRLTIAFGVPGGKDEDRPSGLTTSRDNRKWVVFVFERVKQIATLFLLPPNGPPQPTTGAAVRAKSV